LRDDEEKNNVEPKELAEIPRRTIHRPAVGKKNNRRDDEEKPASSSAAAKSIATVVVRVIVECSSVNFRTAREDGSRFTLLRACRREGLFLR
jgi:hypothetical protein